MKRAMAGFSFSRMKPANLRHPLEAMPFKPFNLHIENGRTLKIQHPDFAMLSPDGWTLVLWGKDGGLYEMVDLDAVTSLELLPSGRRKPVTKG